MHINHNIVDVDDDDDAYIEAILVAIELCEHSNKTIHMS